MQFVTRTTHVNSDKVETTTERTRNVRLDVIAFLLVVLSFVITVGFHPEPRSPLSIIDLVACVLYLAVEVPVVIALFTNRRHRIVFSRYSADA